MVATEAAEDIKDSDREATGLGWDLKGVTLLFISPFQNMATMKDTGKRVTVKVFIDLMSLKCVCKELYLLHHTFLSQGFITRCSSLYG